MNTYPTTNSRSKWPLHLTAAVSALALAALVVPVHSSANNNHNRVGGVRAQIKQGTLVVQGSARANAVALRLQAGNPNRLEVDVRDDGSGEFSFARKRVSAIAVRTAAGDDAVRIDDGNGAFTDSIPTSLAGGRGDDALNGGLGAERLLGGDGKDRVVGLQGNDIALLGGGQDSFRWDPGDGSDEIDGQDGPDTMLFVGAPAGETVTVAAAGGRLIFARQPANITMDTTNVESVDFRALGGPDIVTVSDLRGTDVTEVDVDLAPALGGDTADGQIDEVVVNATNGDDTINIDGSESGADVTGLAAAVSLTHAEATDRLSVNTLAGTDNVFTNGVAVLEVLVDGLPV
jgi:hypothetical protein